MNVKTCGELRTARHVGLLTHVPWFRSTESATPGPAVCRIEKNQNPLATTFIAEFFFCPHNWCLCHTCPKVVSVVPFFFFVFVFVYDAVAIVVAL